VDELHTLVGAGAAEGAIDAANILKPALARGEIQCIGATTLDEYRKHIEKDAALERRFQVIVVEPPSADEAIQILKGLRDKYEAHHRVKFSDESLDAAVHLSDRYISGRALPDKAVDILDEAGSRARLNAMVVPDGMKDLEGKIEGLKKEKRQR
jgi:ATP-dependent Clp protease ATP-binding subunit ClpC